MRGRTVLDREILQSTYARPDLVKSALIGDPNGDLARRWDRDERRPASRTYRSHVCEGPAPSGPEVKPLIAAILEHGRGIAVVPNQGHIFPPELRRIEQWLAFSNSIVRQACKALGC